MQQVRLGRSREYVLSGALPKRVDMASEGSNITVWRLLTVITVCGR